MTHSIIINSPFGADVEAVLREQIGADTMPFEIAFAPHQCEITTDDWGLPGVLDWVDNLCLAKNLAFELDGKIIRYGDEDIRFSIDSSERDDFILGVSRRGVEQLMYEMDLLDAAFRITRFYPTDPTRDDVFLAVRSFSDYQGWILIACDGPDDTARETTTSDTDEAINTVLRWLNGEALDDLEWQPSIL